MDNVSEQAMRSIPGDERPSRLHAALGACMVATALFSLALDALAYEQATHAAMTREAMMQSQLNPTTPDLLQQLGISDRQVSLGSVYVDVDATGNTVNRSANPPNAGGCDQSPPNFGPAKIATANNLSAFQPAVDSLPGWLMLGAVREDDTDCLSGGRENNPQDEPGGTFDRVFSHFYDPYNDRPLTRAALPLGASAPDWATQSTDFNILSAPVPPTFDARSNHFSTPLAREAMWRALTLKSAPAQGMADLPFSPSTDIPTKEALRVAYWATTFRALGDIVHLLQDMAQPQHTRNDAHGGMVCVLASCLSGHASYYEKYVDLIATGQIIYSFPNGLLDQHLPPLFVKGKAPIPYSGYPVPFFSDFRTYFVTATGSASAGGYGMANYSNQGFFSAGTNVGNNNYPYPDASKLLDDPLTNGMVQNAAGFPVPGTLTLERGNVTDSLTSTTNTSVALSARGMFDQFLHPATNQYTLNHYNYDDQIKYLIPKAVAHSAGLLNYFFRGRMDIKLPDAGVYGIVDHAQFAPPNQKTTLDGFVGFNTIKLRLTNSTPPINPSPSGAAVAQDMSNGTLVAALKFHRNGCYNDSLDGEIVDPSQLDLCRTAEEEIVVSDPVAIPGDQGPVPMSSATPSSAEFVFTFGKNSNLPINAWDVVLQVVYRGQLGGEADAVAVVTKDISEPTFISVSNDTDDNIYIAGSCYDKATVEKTDALWNQLSPSCKPSSGGQHVLPTTCINVPLSISLTTAQVNNPVEYAFQYSTAQDGRVLPGRFGRFAVLGDIASPTNGVTSMTLGFANNGVLTLPGGNQTENFTDYQAEKQNIVTFTANTYQTKPSTLADTYVRHRGVHVWQGLFFVIDGTSGAAGGACSDLQLAPLSGPARYPQPATITGWPPTD